MGPAKPRPSSLARRVGGGSNASAGGAVASMEGTMLRQSCLMYTGAHTPPPPEIFKNSEFFKVNRRSKPPIVLLWILLKITVPETHTGFINKIQSLQRKSK